MTNSKFLFFTVLAIFSLTKNSLAWTGYDEENDAQIEIGEGNLVRTGMLIKIYDWSDSQYHWVTVREFNANSARTEIVVQDEETKEIRTFDMEKTD